LIFFEETLKNAINTKNYYFKILNIFSASLIITQFVILPILQRHVSPKTLLQLASIALIAAYGAVTMIGSLYEYLLITAIQTGAYAVAYAESSTQITWWELGIEIGI
jgi:hypothetical protein